jgi:hypothetical protein
MIHALALAVLLQQEIPAKYVEAAKGIELPDLASWREKSPQHAKAVDIIGDRANWALGLKAIDDRLGLFVEKPQVKVAVEESDEPRPAKGAGRHGTGEVRFNIRRVVEYVRKVEELERLREYGKDVKYRVPPTPLPVLIHHELAHCFTGAYDELWVTEGLAAYAATETAHLWEFQNRKASVEPLDAVAERDAYARGYCAVAWIAEKHGRDKLKAFVERVTKDRSAVRKAFEEASGKPWAESLAAERDWAREFLKSYTP